MIGNVEPTKEHVLVLRPSFGSLARVTLRLVRYSRGGLAHTDLAWLAGTPSRHARSS